MYGKECLGVTIDENVNGFLLELGYELRIHDIDVPQVQTDSMGLNTIVYFPRIPYNEVEEG